MSKVDLYPNLKSPPADAKVQTGTAFPADKFAADVNVLGGSITATALTGEVSIKAPTGPYLISSHSVGTTSAAFPTTPLTDRVTLTIVNESATETVYVVNTSGLTTAVAAKLAIGPLETQNWDIDDSNSIFLVAGVATTIKILEMAST